MSSHHTDRVPLSNQWDIPFPAHPSVTTSFGLRGTASTLESFAVGWKVRFCGGEKDYFESPDGLIVGACLRKNGGEGRPDNQDSIFVLARRSTPKRHILVVDGCGGSDHGGLASAATVETVEQGLESIDSIEDVVQTASPLIKEKFEERGYTGNATAVYVGATINEETGEIRGAYLGNARYIRISLLGQLRYQTEPHDENAPDGSRKRVGVCNGKAIAVDPTPIEDRGNPGDRLIFATDGLFKFLDPSKLAPASREFATAEKFRDLLLKMLADSLEAHQRNGDDVGIVIQDLPINSWKKKILALAFCVMSEFRRRFQFYLST